MASLKARPRRCIAERLALEGGNRFANSIPSFYETEGERDCTIWGVGDDDHHGKAMVSDPGNTPPGASHRRQTCG